MPELAVKPTWTRVAFGDVARHVRDRVDPYESGLERFVAGEHMDTDDLRIRRWGTIGEGYLGPAFHMRFKPGHVLYGSRRTYLRKVAVANFEGITANTTYVIESKDPKVLLPELLPFLMQTEAFNEHSVKQSKGSVNPYVNFSDLTWFEFDLPPLGEQHALASLLATADEMTESLLRIPERLRIVEAAFFDQIMARDSPPTFSLGELLTERPRNGCSATEKDEDTGHWVLSLSAISKSGYRSGELKSVDKTEEMAAALLLKGDLVISRSNTLDLVGLPAVFDEDRADVSRPDTMMQLKPDESRLRKRFLEVYLRSSPGRRQVQSYAAGTSASMKKINATNVAKLEVPLPDLSVQLQIEQMAESIRESRALLDEYRRRSQQLRMALLNETMTGRTGASR